MNVQILLTKQALRPGDGLHEGHLHRGPFDREFLDRVWGGGGF